MAKHKLQLSPEQHRWAVRYPAFCRFQIEVLVFRVIFRPAAVMAEVYSISH